MYQVCTSISQTITMITLIFQPFPVYTCTSNTSSSSEPKGKTMYEYDEGEPYVPPTPKRRATAGQDYTYAERRTEAHPRQQAPPQRNHHSLFWVGLGMLVCLALWMGISLVVLPWWHGLQVQWHY